MATKINTGTQASVTAANSITVNSASASAGNTLVLQLSWIDNNSATATTLTAPVGWTAAYNPTSSANGAACGYAVFYKTASAGVNSATVNEPSGTGNFYANGIITEWSGMGTPDTAAMATSVLVNNAAASTTGATVPNTGTLANAASTIFTGVSILCGAGLNNATIAFSGGSWTTEAQDQNTQTSVGTLFGDKVVAVSTALNAVYTWTSDSTMLCYQAAIVVFSDAGGVAGNQLAWIRA